MIPDDTIAWLLGTGHLSALDEDGRPIGEQASPLYDASRDRRLTFGDPRDATGLPCNVEALAQVRSVWPAILDALRAFEPDRPLTYGALFRKVMASTSLAKLTAMRGSPVSRAVSSLYKVTIGFSDLFAALLLDTTIDADAQIGAEELLFEWLDERPFLIGQRQVCAGSRAQIRAVWRALREREGRYDGWDTAGLDEVTELSALAACAAGAARAYALEGRLDEAPEYGTALPRHACLRLIDAPETPRLCETLRRTSNAGALHPTLLFESSAVPASLRTFIDALPDAARSDTPLASTDALLLECARPVAARITGGEITLDAFLRACA